MEEQNQEYYLPEEKKPSVIGKIFKTIAIFIIIAIYLILFIRMFVSCDSKIVDMVLKTPEIEAEYARNPKEFEIRQYEITNWYKSKNPAGNEESNMGGKLLSVDELYHIPQTKNLQISIKFNLDILGDDTNYSIDNLPFKVYLEDENLKIYDKISAIEYDERYSFGYIRVCFDDIVLEKIGEQPDEYGNSPRKNYELYLERRNADGEFVPYDSFSIYTGSLNYKLVAYR